MHCDVCGHVENDPMLWDAEHCPECGERYGYQFEGDEADQDMISDLEDVVA